MDKTRYVIGNWKMNVDSADMVAFSRELKKFKFPRKTDLQVGFAVPSIYALGLSKLQESVWVGAQNVSKFTRGDYTGEISAEMIADCGLDFCLVGQSERRIHFGETDEIVNHKLKNLQEYGVLPVVCVGETEDERMSGRAEQSITKRLRTILNDVNKDEEIIIAYEPIKADNKFPKLSTKDIKSVIEAIRQELNSILGERNHIVLYGGEVTETSCFNLLTTTGVDGFLLGSESANGEKLIRIVSSLF